MRTAVVLIGNAYQILRPIQGGAPRKKLIQRSPVPATRDDLAKRRARHVVIDPDIAEYLSDQLARAPVNSYRRDQEAKRRNAPKSP
jgi:hypothetical protein